MGTARKFHSYILNIEKFLKENICPLFARKLEILILAV